MGPTFNDDRREDADTGSFWRVPTFYDDRRESASESMNPIDGLGADVIETGIWSVNAPGEDGQGDAGDTVNEDLHGLGEDGQPDQGWGFGEDKAGDMPDIDVPEIDVPDNIVPSWFPWAIGGTAFLVVTAVMLYLARPLLQIGANVSE